jgi:hypothetical protein
MQHDEILVTLADPSTSYWLRDALKTAIKRDPVDALNDAEKLVELLTNWHDLTANVTR